VSENAALVARSFRAIRDRDLDAMLALYHPDVEFLPLTGTRVESGGYRGHAGMREYMRECDELWEIMEPEGELFEDFGGCVVVLGRCRVRGRSSGAESNPVCAWVVGVRDGLIVSSRACTSYEEAVEAARTGGTVQSG
jgi:ketosteroid isomerase-like protein